MLGTHATKLERWLGAELVAQISERTRTWYGPPIALAGVPGRVFALGGGDFRGRIETGSFASARCAAEKITRRIRKAARLQAGQLNTGFASLSDLISEATAGKKRIYPFQKAGSTGVVNVASSLWRQGNLPSAGVTPAAAPGGLAPTDATAGGHPFTNPTGGDTQHFTTGYSTASTAANSLLLYDRIFHVAKTMNSSATEAVTGVPTRYQASSGEDSSAGNFLFVEVGGTALAATAHNWTVCTYTDESGNTGATLPSLTGNSAAIVDRLDHPVGQWFAPLAAGDTGVRALTQMQCSAAVATGAINFVIGHPLAFLPCPVANMVCVADGINTAFNLVRIFDDACLAFLEMPKPATTATTYSGMFETVSG
jgi:hypothetical protein